MHSSALGIRAMGYANASLSWLVSLYIIKEFFLNI